MSSDLIRKVPMISPMLEITDRCHGLGRRFAPYRLSDHPISATTRQITQSSFVPSWSTCPRDGFKSIVVDVLTKRYSPGCPNWEQLTFLSAAKNLENCAYAHAAVSRVAWVGIL